MLPREKRITNTRDYQRVYQKGSFFSARLANINLIPNRSTMTRLGIVVTKKVAAKATERNLIKRRFREAARTLYDLLPAGYDIVVTIKGGSQKADFAEIEKELKEAFTKVGNK
jgi:ribonuclease P protein component